MIRFKDIVNNKKVLEQIESNIEPFINWLEREFDSDYDDEERGQAIDYLLHDFQREIISRLYRIEEFDDEKKKKVEEIFETIEEVAKQKEVDKIKEVIEVL